MNTNIFIPEKIRVGFQKRSDTYTGRLAYVIYFGPDGKIRKEKSWEQWRHKNIESMDFDNVPTEGFVLNKRAGGDYTGHWGNRQMTCRTYDPRGFEYEISVDNLIWILENTDSIKGKGLVGEFVYGWDKDKLVLIPTSSPDYQEIKAYTQMVTKPTRFKARDMVVGATYATKSQPELVYLGQFERFAHDYASRSDFVYNSEGVCFWFLIPTDHSGITLHTTKSLGAIMQVTDDGPHPRLEWALERMQHDDSFSPRSHVAFEPMDAKKRAMFLLDRSYWRYFYVNEHGEYKKFSANSYNLDDEGHQMPPREDGLPHSLYFRREDTYHYMSDKNLGVFSGVMSLGQFLDLQTPIYERVVYLKNGRPEKDSYNE